MKTYAHVIMAFHKTSVGDPWQFDADTDPAPNLHLWLMDPDSTPFLIDFKDANNFFLDLPAGTLPFCIFSLKNLIFNKILC